MIAVPERVRVTMAMLSRAANADAACPSNTEIASAIGAHSSATGASTIALLETMGLISVKRNRLLRVVTIAASGKSTAGTVRNPIVAWSKPAKQGWSRALDDVLMEAISQDLDFEQVAHLVGRSAEQCAARFDELAARFGRQAA